MKKLVALFLALSMLLSLTAMAGAESDGRVHITFWYAHTGDEALVFENAIATYNASQDKVFVEGVSTTDTQKLIVAMGSDEAPDVISASNQQMIQYMANGLLDVAQDYSDKDGFDLSVYSEKSIEASSVGGRLVGLPIEAYSIQMFYNKDLLEAAGYSEPPTTVEQMYEMAVAVTKLDENGNIDVLGYPLFPYASARQELIYAFGGRWWDEDSNLTPQNEGVLASLNMNVKYRQLYGMEAVDAFVSTANTNRYTEQDMFFAGKQLFRLDGSWLPTMMANYGSTVNYGITFIPGTEEHPEYRGSSRYETTCICMPSMGRNKEAAWDFTKWMGTEGARIENLGTGNLPALKALYEDPEILAMPGYAEFIEALKLEKGVQYPVMDDFGEYVSMINNALDEVYAGVKTPEQAMADLAEQSAGLN
ncbi:MAG: ABC transporter substrate-binding protein [Clostridia bacterium]|nr:ABC transporter substrate-binding protein [Clostridia bacterium]